MSAVFTQKGEYQQKRKALRLGSTLARVELKRIGSRSRTALEHAV